MLTDLAFGLATATPPRDVVVITSRLSYDDPSALLPVEETMQGARILRVRTSRFGRAFLPGRALDYLTFYLSAALMLLRVAAGGMSSLPRRIRHSSVSWPIPSPASRVPGS